MRLRGRGRAWNGASAEHPRCSALAFPSCLQTGRLFVDGSVLECDYPFLLDRNTERLRSLRIHSAHRCFLRRHAVSAVVEEIDLQRVCLRGGGQVLDVARKRVLRAVVAEQVEGHLGCWLAEELVVLQNRIAEKLLRRGHLL